MAAIYVPNATSKQADENAMTDVILKRPDEQMNDLIAFLDVVANHREKHFQDAANGLGGGEWTEPQCERACARCTLQCSFATGLEKRVRRQLDELEHALHHRGVTYSEMVGSA